MREQILAIIRAAEAAKNSYFWQTPGSASARRSMEARYSAPMVEWTEGGHTYSARFDVTCSCAHVYARGKYLRDGRKTTLTAIRNSAARLAA